MGRHTYVHTCARTHTNDFAQSFVFYILARDLTLLACLEKTTLPAIPSEGKSDAIFLERKQLFS